MSAIWLIPTAVFVLGALAVARQSLLLRTESELTAVAIDEAAEAMAVVASVRDEVDVTADRVEAMLRTARSPVRAVRQVRSTTRHWWWRARRRMVDPDVPSTP